MGLISQDQANLLLKNGFLITDIQSYSSKLAQTCLSNFMYAPESYRKTFLQDQFEFGFDGYSFLGQYNSTNQDVADLVHTFVLSNMHDKKLFPKELYNLIDEFANFQSMIKRLEQEVYISLGLKSNDFLGMDTYMISCNYYPKMKLEDNTEARLTEHKDISFLTIFPYGNPDGLEYRLNDIWQPISSQNKIMIHLGYGLEYLYPDRVKAAKHRVAAYQMDRSRYSFAYFSIPNPKKYPDKTQAYFKEYLDLFA